MIFVWKKKVITDIDVILYIDVNFRWKRKILGKCWTVKKGEIELWITDEHWFRWFDETEREKREEGGSQGVECPIASLFVEAIGGGASLPSVAWLLVPPLHRSDKEQGGSWLGITWWKSRWANWIDLRIEFALWCWYLRYLLLNKNAMAAIFQVWWELKLIWILARKIL